MENTINPENIEYRISSIIDIDDILEYDSKEAIPLFTSSKLEEEIQSDSNYCISAIYFGKIVGYGSISILYDHSDLLYISTSQEFKRNGIAENILNILIDKSIELNLESIFIEVRESNIPAISLYEKLEFKKISTRSNYYTNPNENAIILKRDL